jgi:Domain of unknown function (DUF5753)
VLHRQIGGPDIARGQLTALRDAAARPGVTIQVLLFTVGAHAGMDEMFALRRVAHCSPGSRMNAYAERFVRTGRSHHRHNRSLRVPDDNPDITPLPAPPHRISRKPVFGVLIN